MTHHPLIRSGMKPSIRMKFVLAAVFVLVACGSGGNDTGSPGIEGSRCYPNGTCNTGLLCRRTPPVDVCEKVASTSPLVGGSGGVETTGGATGAGGAETGGATGVGDAMAAGGVCLNCNGGAMAAGGVRATGAVCTTDTDCAGPDTCVYCSFGGVVCSKCQSGHCSILGVISGSCISGGLDYGAGSFCGNGYFNVGLEECDGTNLNGATCDSLSAGALPYGKLFCSPTCTRVLLGCSAVPVGTGGAAGTGGATSSGGTDAGKVTDAAAE